MLLRSPYHHLVLHYYHWVDYCQRGVAEAGAAAAVENRDAVVAATVVVVVAAVAAVAVVVAAPFGDATNVRCFGSINTRVMKERSLCVGQDNRTIGAG
jgi:hypothetical protein